jgi:hypothetical protein
MNKFFYAVCALLLSTHANAACYGSGAFRTCTDDSGNSYNVQKYGNTTTMQGYNAGTGSQWNQTSQTFGNSTYIQGNSNGRTWNEQIHTSPGMTTYSGTDSLGRSFNKTCTALGCF